MKIAGQPSQEKPLRGGTDRDSGAHVDALPLYAYPLRFDWTRRVTRRPRRCAEYGRELAEREFEVLHLIAHGLTNAEVGEEMFISPVTVKSTLYNIQEKLGTKGGRTTVVGLAYRSGLLAQECCSREEPQPPLEPGSEQPAAPLPYDDPVVAHTLAVSIGDWVQKFTDSPETFDQLCESMRARQRAFLGLDVA